MKKDDQLTIVAEDGTESLVTIIFTFEANDRHYIVFEFEDTKDISAAVFVPDESQTEGTLLDIETDEEWDLVDDVINQYYDDLENDDVDDEG